MHYKELLSGVNAYASKNRNQEKGFPTSLYAEDTFYLDALYNTQSITDRAVNFLRGWNRRVPINKVQLQTAYQNVPQNVLSWCLQNLALWSHKPLIIQTFYEFIDAVRYTGASKALHILNPKLFMMWDYKIRRGYGCSENEEGYFNFLLRSQKEVQEVIQTYQSDYPTNGEISLRIYTGRAESIAKLLDEYNFAKYTKEWI